MGMKFSSSARANWSGLKTLLGLGVTEEVNSFSMARGMCGVGEGVGVSVTEGVGVMVGVSVIVGESVIVGVSVMVGVSVGVPVGGRNL